MKKFFQKYKNYIIVDGIMYVVLLLLLIFGIIIVRVFFWY